MGADLVQVLLFIASDLDARSYAYSGAIRRAAALLQQLQAATAIGAPDTCARCGRPLEQRPTGRPRKWCNDRCRRKVPKSPFFSELRQRESA
jgi:hypothetical protein